MKKLVFILLVLFSTIAHSQSVTLFKSIKIDSVKTQTGATYLLLTMDTVTKNIYRQAIPAGGTQADWNASSGAAQILNKPSDLTGFTHRSTAGTGQGDVNITVPVSELFVELFEITASTNLTVGLSTASTTGAKTLHKVIANTNTNATYNWEYAVGTDVIKADGTAVTSIPKGKTHTLFYSYTQSKWILTSEF
jgi:hypothetical protein